MIKQVLSLFILDVVGKWKAKTWKILQVGEGINKIISSDVANFVVVKT